MRNPLILLIIACVMFMEAVDTTIINTAVPVIAQSLNVNPIDLKLTLISYLLSLAIFIPISGWIADKYGAKKVFISAVILFTLSSIWCGFTHNLMELILARITQGIGGSLTLPLGRLIIIRTYKRHELIAKMSIVVMVASFGMMLGPLLGGLITTHFSWRWIFWVNIPVGSLTAFFAYKLLPAMPARRTYALDKLGFCLFGSGLAMFTLGLSIISESHFDNTISVIVLTIALVLLLFYTWHSSRQKHPIINVQLLSTRTFRIAVLGNLLSRLGFGGMPFLLPLLLQISLGYSPQLAGLLLAPVALGVLSVKPVSLSILRFCGYKKLLLINTLMISLSLWSFAYIHANSSLYFIASLTFLYGFFIAIQYTAMNSLAYANIEDNHISAATSIMSTVQQLGQSFGVAMGAILLRFFSPKGNLPLTLETFHHTFFVISLATCLAVFIFISMKMNDGHELLYGN